MDLRTVLLGILILLLTALVPGALCERLKQSAILGYWMGSSRSASISTAAAWPRMSTWRISLVSFFLESRMPSMPTSGPEITRQRSPFLR